MLESGDKCPCKKSKCERHGNCTECRKHHADSKRKRPVACEKEKRDCSLYGSEG